MQTLLLYGKEGLSIEIPEHSVVLEPKNLPGLKDEEGAVLEALKSPIGSAPLRERVESNG